MGCVDACVEDVDVGTGAEVGVRIGVGVVHC